VCHYAALAATNAVSAWTDHARDLGLPHNRSVRGRRVPATPGMIRWMKFIMPRNRRSGKSLKPGYVEQEWWPRMAREA
jgi:hypothetical protein